MTTEADHDREALMLSRLFERLQRTDDDRAVIDAATALVDRHRENTARDAWHAILMADLAAAVDRRRVRT